MKCSEVRGSFSAKVDGELAWDSGAQVDAHLGNCPDCHSAWVKFRATVSLLHALPEASSQPAFVGQVFDRVRDYEARGARALQPIGSARRVPSFAWVATVREWFGASVLRPVPALALGALVIGVAVGSWVNHLSIGTGSGSEGVAGTVAAREAERSVDPVRLDPVLPERPFEDLADEIRARELETSTARTEFYSPNWGGTGIQQQVRFDNDGPRIIF